MACRRHPRCSGHHEGGRQVERDPGCASGFLGEDVDELLGGDQISPRRHLTVARIIERHPGQPARGVTGEVDAAADQDAETVQRVAGIPASREVALTAVGSATAKVMANRLRLRFEP